MTQYQEPFVYPDHGVLLVETSSNDLLHKWRNSIDMIWDDAIGPPGPEDAIVEALITFLKGGQRDDCFISNVALRPWSKGNLPFSEQSNIWSQVVNVPCKNWGAGTVYPIAPSSGLIPLGELCVLLNKPKFGVGGGKPGHMFIRNSISQDSVTSTPGGPPALVPADVAVIPLAWDNWASTNLESYCTDNPFPRFTLVHAAVVNASPPKVWEVFDTALQVPIFQRLTMHDIT